MGGEVVICIADGAICPRVLKRPLWDACVRAHVCSHARAACQINRQQRPPSCTQGDDEEREEDVDVGCWKIQRGISRALKIETAVSHPAV